MSWALGVLGNPIRNLASACGSTPTGGGSFDLNSWPARRVITVTGLRRQAMTLVSPRMGIGTSDGSQRGLDLSSSFSLIFVTVETNRRERRLSIAHKSSMT